MVVKILGYVGTAIVAGILVQQIQTTNNLAKVDTGLSSSLHSTTALAKIEESVIGKNKILKQVVATTKTTDGQLSSTLDITKTINGNIHQIDAANEATLALNKGMVSISGQSKQTLYSVSQELSQLNISIQKLKLYLTQLDNLVSTDKTSLGDMKFQTDIMNQKVPG